MAVWELFGVRLKELREKAGLTQGQLAEKAGLTLDGVGQFERGRRQPSWETVCRLAKALGVDCTAFAEEQVEPSAEAQEPRKPGRPRKAVEQEAEEPQAVEKPAKKPRKRKEK